MGIKTESRADAGFARQVVMTKNVTIDAAAVDAGNTGQTHILRAGLVLGRVTASGQYREYDNGNADGTEDADCILMYQTDLKGGDPSATAVDTVATVMWIGEAVSSECIGYDANAATDLAKAGSGLGYIEFS